MSDADQMNTEDQAEESLEAPGVVDETVQDELPQECAEVPQLDETVAEMAVDNDTEREEGELLEAIVARIEEISTDELLENEISGSELDRKTEDGAIGEVGENTEERDVQTVEGTVENDDVTDDHQYEYEDDFEPEDDEENVRHATAETKPSDSPTRSILSVHAKNLIDNKMSEILNAFSGDMPEEESQSHAISGNRRKGSSSSTSSDSDSCSDAVDGNTHGEEEDYGIHLTGEDGLDGVTEEHRLARLHAIIRENDYRKFRWFSSLFLSDVIDLEELCLVDNSGVSGLSLLGELGRTKMLKRLSELGVLLYHQDTEGQAAIHRAVRNGHAKTVNYLCTLGQSNYQDSDGMTPLHICAATKHIKVMEALLNHVDDVDVAYGSSRLTSLMLACMNGCVAMVTCLLRAGAKLEASNSVGNTCLHLAAANNQLPIVKTLLEFERRLADVGACSDGALNKQNNHGATPLHTALQLQHFDVVDRLLEAGADPTVKEQHGMGAAHVAAVLGSEAGITLLEIHGADLNAQDDRGATPLLLAVLQGRKEVVKKLLVLGVSPDGVDLEGVTSLHAACRGGDSDIVLELCESGAKLDVVNKHSMTPLCIAVAAGHTELVKILIEKGANPNSVNDEAMSPVLIACQRMRAPLVEVLLAAGGDPFVAGPESQPPVHFVIKHRYTSILNMILDKHNDMTSLRQIVQQCTLEDVEFLRHSDFQCHKDKQNNSGATVLHCAITEGNSDTAGILLRLGCNPNIQDRDGNTPVHCACVHGRGDLVEVLTDSYHTNVHLPNNQGDTCMNLAIQNGREEIVSFLLTCQTMGDNRAQILPLMVQAITAGQHGVAEMLLVNGSSDIQRYNDWKQLVHMAVEHGSASLVTAMLEKGPIDVHSSVTESEETCLHLAARSGNLATTMELIMRKSEVNKQNALLRKPIHYAALEGHSSIVEVLLDCGTKVSLVDEDGMPDYYLAKHQPVWNLLKTWCKTHPASVTTAPSPGTSAQSSGTSTSPSAPPGDSLDGRRSSTRSARMSLIVGEVDGFQEVGTPTHVRLPPVTSRRSSDAASQPRTSGSGSSPLTRSPARSRAETEPSIYDSFRGTLL